MRWPALQTLQTATPASRVPFVVAGARAGSVARAHLAALRAWPDALHVGAEGVTLTVAPAEASAALAHVNAALRQQGLVLGWRDEIFGIVCPATGRHLACTERAAARFWGTLTFGAHATGYLAGADGRPTHLWIARRSRHKSTDPGLFDNLVGGGVPFGQTPHQALLREGWEEAGVAPARWQSATRGRVLHVQRTTPAGWQTEHLHTWDLRLQPGETPLNQDGEVERFDCLPLPDALALAAGQGAAADASSNKHSDAGSDPALKASPGMTVDAALVTLDFALRHHLLDAAAQAALGPALQRLFVPGDFGAQTR